MAVYLVLLTVFSFLSISIYEGLVILGLLIFGIRKKINKGYLFIPLCGFVGTTLISTYLVFWEFHFLYIITCLLIYIKYFGEVFSK